MQIAAAAKPLTPKRKMLCLPSAGGNPYQALMYGELTSEHDIEFENPNGLSRLDEGEFATVHIHWDDRMFGRGDSEQANENTLNAALDRLRKFKSSGGRIVWTIHNDTPHKAIDLETFRKGRFALCQLADVIHVHADHAADHMVKAYGARKETLHVVPHPSYLGAYEPAEQTLHRPFPAADKRQFLFFGMFRGSKGIHAIREVAGKLTKRNVPYHLKMYGKAFSSQVRLLRLLAANVNIDLRTDRIPDSEVPEIFGSSHVFLAPYQSLFTSGSVMLALTFGLPIIGPNIRELRETTPDECHGLLYDPQSPRGLIRSMLRYVEMSDDDLRNLRSACLSYAKDRDPNQVSAQLSQLISL